MAAAHPQQQQQWGGSGGGGAYYNDIRQQQQQQYGVGGAGPYPHHHNQYGGGQQYHHQHQQYYPEQNIINNNPNMAFYYDPESRGGGGAEGGGGHHPHQHQGFVGRGVCGGDVWVDDEKLRRTTEHAFIRKVYGIVATQLAITFLVSLLFLMNQTLQIFLLTNAFPILVTATIASVCLICAIMCNKQLLRNYPTNYIFLFAFTLAESFLLAFVCVVSGTLITLQAIIATTAIVVALTLFAFQTKYDFTSWMGGLYFALIGLFAFGLLKALFFHSPTIDLIYAVCAAALFCIYIVVDTQMLMSRSQFSLGSDDYILAALTLYVDIINLFLQVLEILRDCQNSN